MGNIQYRAESSEEVAQLEKDVNLLNIHYRINTKGGNVAIDRPIGYDLRITPFTDTIDVTRVCGEDGRPFLRDAEYAEIRSVLGNSVNIDIDDKKYLIRTSPKKE
jgi:hypothetical protein